MSLLPDLYVYNGAIFTLAAIAVFPQQRYYLSLVLLVVAAFFFASRIYLDSKELTVREVWERGHL
jgi:hypothetical protein